MKFDPRYLQQMIEGDDLSTPQSLLKYVLAAGQAQAQPGGGRSTMPSGSTMYRAGPGEGFENDAGSFAKSDALYALASGGASDLPPAMDDDQFRLKILQDRINRGEGREVGPDGQVVNKNKAKYDDLAAILAGKKKESQADEMLGIERMKAEGTLAAAQGKGSGEQFTRTTGLRKELETLPEVVALKEVTPIFNSLIKSRDDSSSISDLDFTYGIAKMLDPGSVVREGEQIIIKNAGGLPSAVLSAIGFAQGNKTLSPEVRAGLLNLAGRRYDALRMEVEQKIPGYENIAKQNQLDFGQVNLLPKWQSAKELLGGQQSGLSAEDRAQVEAIKQRMRASR